MSERELKIKISGDASGATGALKETERGFAGAEGGGRELHKTLGDLNRMGFGPLGESLHALAGGPGGLLLIAATAMLELKNAIDENNKALDDQMAKNADPAFQGAMEAREKSIKESADAWSEYTTKLRLAADSQDYFSMALERTLALQKAQAQATVEVQSAEAALEQARIQYQVRTGQISPAAGVVAGAAAKIQSNNAEEKAREAGRQAELDAKAASLRARQADKDAADAAVAAAKTEADDAKKKADEDAAKLKNASDNVRKLREAYFTAENKVHDPTASINEDLVGMATLTPPSVIKGRHQADAAAALLEWTRAQADINRLGSTHVVDAERRAAKDAASTLTEREGKVEQLNTGIAQLKEAIGTLSETIKTANAADRTVTQDQNMAVVLNSNLASLTGRAINTTAQILDLVNELAHLQYNNETRLQGIRTRNPGGSN